MNWKEWLRELVPVLGQAGVDALVNELEEITEGQEGWERNVLAIITNAIEKYGPAGIDMALEALLALKKDETPDIDWADLRVASDLLATLQTAEADKKTAAHDFGVKVAHALGKILTAILKGAIIGG